MKACEGSYTFVKERHRQILQRGGNLDFTHRFSVTFPVPGEAQRPSSCLDSKLLITLSFLLKSAQIDFTSCSRDPRTKSWGPLTMKS